VGSSA